MNTKILLFCIALAVLAGCRKGMQAPEVQTADFTENTVPPEIKEILVRSGFDTTHVSMSGDNYLVEDIIITPKHIKAFKQQLLYSPDQRHAYTDNVVTGNNTNITIALHSSIVGSGRWRNALAYAIHEWNSVGDCRVNFIQTDAASADIIVAQTDMGEYQYGLAEFPSGGQPGSTVYVTNRFQLRDPDNGNALVQLTTGMDMWVMIHELGHCIGFRHTDWHIYEGTAGIGANVVPNTPDNDPNSVMNSGNTSWLETYSGLSQFDVEAVQFLYPVINGTVFETFINGQQWIFASSQRIHTAGNFYNEGHYEWRLYDAGNTLIHVFGHDGPVLEWDNWLLEDDDYYLECMVTNLEAPGVTYRKHLITYD